MNTKSAIEKRKQSRLEDILDFCVELSRRMIVSGANLERVNLSIERICHAYGLHEVSCLLLTTRIQLCARDHEGRYCSRTLSIPPAGIDLEKLKQLNRLSYTVVEKQPSTERLMKMLDDASVTRGYPDWVIMLGRVGAMISLCLIFGGTWRELIPVVLVTVMMHYLMALMALPSLDKIVVNAVTMFIATTAVLFITRTGISEEIPVIIITISMLVIPGIPLVNAVRNLLCGFEMNGTLQLMKVIVETLAMAMGIYLALWIFGEGIYNYDIQVTPMTDPLLLIIFSFTASVSFGVTQRIRPHDLFLAGLGSAITRVALIFFSAVSPTRLVYVSVSALVAALYAELLANLRRDPSTYFIYPSIVPLIPGDLFYYALIGMYLSDRGMFETNGLECLLALIGMSIGFVVSSIIAHYIRKMRHMNLVKATAKLIHK